MISFLLKIRTFLKKYLKWILGAVALVVVIILGSVSGSKGQQLKDADVQIQVLQQQVVTQQELIQKLAAMESVRCEVSLTVKNTAVLGANHSGAVNLEAEQIATCLRGEILDKIMEDQRQATTKERPETQKTTEDK